MNENADPSPKPDVHPLPPILPPEIPLPQRPLSYWLRRILACNPFYLGSAALLLYGIYRVSIDPGFLGWEIAQLCFNLTSLQGYEILVVVTAVFLARHALRYDSTLLIWLENLLVLVPFILISQAGLINLHVVWLLSVAAGCLAAVRFHALRRFVGHFPLPPRLALAGLLLLAANAALPVFYRTLHEDKIGTKPDWGPAFQTNQYMWWLLLPALCLAIPWLSRPVRSGQDSARALWAPLGILTLWLAGTGVHLYSLGYIYDFELRPDLVAPLVWLLGWVAHACVPRLIQAVTPAWRNTLLVPPLAATLLAVGAAPASREVFLALTILNLGLYGLVVFRDRSNRFACHLAALSALALLARMPVEWGQLVTAEFHRARWIGVAAASYLLFWTAFSRSPRLGLLGAFVAGISAALVQPEHSQGVHWGLQIGLAFLLAHSLRWQDDKEPGAGALRWITGVVWVAHSAVWLHLGGAAGVTLTLSGLVFSIYGIARWLGGQWGPRAVPFAALLSLLSGPGEFLVGQLQEAPIGLLAILGSFLLFGLGTIAALTRHHWGKAE